MVRVMHAMACMDSLECLGYWDLVNLGVSNRGIYTSQYHSGRVIVPIGLSPHPRTVSSRLCMRFVARRCSYFRVTLA
jgi:hypothetical protein